VVGADPREISGCDLPRPWENLENTTQEVVIQVSALCFRKNALQHKHQQVAIQIKNQINNIKNNG
jgi:hypothetical protein